MAPSAAEELAAMFANTLGTIICIARRGAEGGNENSTQTLAGGPSSTQS